MTLYRRLLLGSSSVAALTLGVLLLAPTTLAFPPTAGELGWVAVAFALLVAASGWVTHLALRPLDELGKAMESTTSSLVSVPVDVRRPDEVGRVARSYNAMLERLRAERARSTAMALQAQESERKRISRELHDEVGQTLTAALLTLGRADALPDPDARALVGAASDAVRAALTEVRGISARLRPGVLDDLGLIPALTSLCTHTATLGPLHVTRELLDPGPRTPEQDLALYRVCQEALTNVVRHAGAARAHVTLAAEGHDIVLRVDDDGVGVSNPPGIGRQGMAERAILVGGSLTIGPGDGGGTRVELRIPGAAAAPPAA